VTYHFYPFVGKFPKFFNFSDSMEKIYLVELNIFKENAIYGLQEILLDNFPQNFCEPGGSKGFLAARARANTRAS